MFQTAHEQPFLLNLYGCCNGRTPWPLILENLCTQFQCKHAMVQKLSPGRTRLAGGVWLSSDDNDTARYNRHISDFQNPRLERKRLGERAVGKIVVDEQLFDPHEQAEKQLFLDKLSNLGVQSFMGGLAPLDNEDAYLGIALHRSAQDKRLFTPAEQAQLQILLPHIGQA
ncbi:TPA: hypothetical protein ACHP5V_006383, partial [Pseudomonas aeruginosa]